jgi:hypothetical protein
VPRGEVAPGLVDADAAAGGDSLGPVRVIREVGAKRLLRVQTAIVARDTLSRLTAGV